MKIKHLVSLLAVVTLMGLGLGCGHGIDTGDGKKIGQVIQLGKHGWLCSTYEGKLVRGGFNTGSGVSGGVFDFTVESEDLYSRLMKAMELQQEVEVSYKKVNLSGPCACESDHFITSFRVLDSQRIITVTDQPNAAPATSEKERKIQQLLHEILSKD